jgi:uncharacterized CHY-type Zn-finger protein
VAYTLSNAGSGATTEGRLSLVASSTNEVIWTEDSPSVQGGGSDSGTITIDSWPAGNAVDLELTWTVNGIAETAFKSYPSKSTTMVSSFEIPWAALIYGTIAGIVIASITRFVFSWQDGDPKDKAALKEKRGVARARAREQVKSSRADSAAPAEKQEVHCPSCDQMLRVPSDYSGIARCPACRHQFGVEAVELPESEPSPEPEPSPAIETAESPSEEPEPVKQAEAKSVSKKQPAKEASAPTPRKKQAKQVAEKPSDDDELVASSSGDEIRCPSCAQRLKVPYDRRPVKARCPNCKSEFQAQRG